MNAGPALVLSQTIHTEPYLSRHGNAMVTGAGIHKWPVKQVSVVRDDDVWLHLLNMVKESLQKGHLEIT